MVTPESKKNYMQPFINNNTYGIEFDNTRVVEFYAVCEAADIGQRPEFAKT